MPNYSIDEIEKLQINVINNSKTKSIHFYYLIMILAISLASISNFHLKFMTTLCGKADSNQMLFYRSFISSLLSCIYLRLKKISIPTYWNVGGSSFWFSVRNFSAFICSISLLMCFDFMRLSTCTVFSALSPVFSSILSVIILKEKFYSRYILGITICFIGCMLLIFNDESSKRINEKNFDNNSYIEIKTHAENDEIQKKWNLDLINKVIGLCFGIVHTLSLSFNHVSTKILLKDNIEINILLFYSGLFNCIASFFTWQIIGSYDYMWFDKCFVLNNSLNGILFYTFSFLLAISLKNLDLIKTVAIGYLQIVETFILGALFLGESVHNTDILGSSIIVLYNLLNSLFPIK